MKTTAQEIQEAKKALLKAEKTEEKAEKIYTETVWQEHQRAKEHMEAKKTRQRLQEHLAFLQGKAKAEREATTN